MIEFCKNTSLSEKIKKEVLPLFLNLEESQVECLYQYFSMEYQTDPYSDNMLIKQELNIIKETYLIKKDINSLHYFGIDIPCWFNINESSKNIMIIGLDPLRNQKKYKDKLEFGTPYAFHIKSVREKNTKKYFDFVEGLAINYGVYITDASKIFYKEKLTNKRSTNCKIFWGNELHFKVLKKEIELVKPKLIITLGVVPAHMLSGFRVKTTDKINLDLTTYEDNFGLIPLICLPHLSNANNSNINKFLNINITDYKNKTQVESYLELVKLRLKNNTLC
ncbi:MAG: uracil-DNA glycosylase family protein [Flavobacteriales bacterium]|nr:uracil-DNA glycosylase family protein [Flavobacteriales bacterium]